jgi:ATP-dependent DNA helicase RecG
MIRETQHIELKPSFNEDVIETLVAFANTKGGKVLVVVEDKGKPVKNFTVGKESVQKWINEIKTKTQPQIIPDWEIVNYEDTEVVEFSIQEYPIKPVSTRGKYYKRIGNSNHLLSAGEVANMHLRTVNSSWDYYPRPNKTLADISIPKVEKAMKTMRKRNNNFEFETPIEFLMKNELLLSDNRISNGCFLMFSEGENLYTTIQMGHFASEIVIKDDVVNSDDILTQVDEVMAFIRKHINKELIISDEQIENIQRWQYPLDAIREIVLNMIIHRDYTSAYNSIIKIFPERMQFYNPGKLPDSISIEQLRTNDYISQPKNRQIAKTIKEMGWIERYGTGIKRVIRMFSEYSLPEPVFEEMSDGMSVTVYGLNFDEKIKKFVDSVAEVTPQVPPPSNPPSNPPSRKVIVGTTARGNWEKGIDVENAITRQQIFQK